jgi:D-tyrosyl-tRNA(Tyr) deacylase
MLSYDYNHFEVILSAPDDASFRAINELRKNANRLCNEAIRQFRVAKEKAQKQASLMGEKRILADEVREIEAIPEGERTATQKAKVKALADHDYWTQNQYDFDDDRDQDIPF